MPYGTIAADVITGTNGNSFSPESSVFRNRIINGAMVIDQRNAGASVNNSNNTYTLDRWVMVTDLDNKFSVQQNAGSVTPPAGFTNYLGVTSTAATSVGSGGFYIISQKIEGYNVADLAWGTANAKTVTLSFWVRSSLTGTFGGSIQNGNGNRSYPFTYTISAANTWEYKTVTVAGDTSGTWLTTNGIGLQLFLGLGVGTTYSGTAGAWAGANYGSATGATSVVGTNGATWYITGVQLEVGSQATSFDYRQYGTEFALCQRYYEKSYEPAILPGTNGATSGITYQYVGRNISNLYGIYHTRFRVDKRGTATITLYSLNGTAGQISDNDSGSNVGAATIYYASTTGFIAVNNSGGTMTAAALGWHYTASSEL